MSRKVCCVDNGYIRNAGEKRPVCHNNGTDIHQHSPLSTRWLLEQVTDPPRNPDALLFFQGEAQTIESTIPQAACVGEIQLDDEPHFAVPKDSLYSVYWLHAKKEFLLLVHSHRNSRFGRDHSNCRESLADDSEHNCRDGLMFP